MSDGTDVSSGIPIKDTPQRRIAQLEIILSQPHIQILSRNT